MEGKQVGKKRIIRNKDRPCRECGLYFNFGNDWQNVCEFCADRYKEKYTLKIDVGSYHVKLNTALMSPTRVSRVIDRSCRLAEKIKKEMEAANKVS